MKYSFTIKKTHPSLKGHFPGNPIVPGVVILDEVIQIIKIVKPDFMIIAMPIVKFTQPLLAEQNVHVEIKQKTNTTISFICTYNDIKLAAGQLTLERLS